MISSQPLCYGSFWATSLTIRGRRLLTSSSQMSKKLFLSMILIDGLRNDVYRYQERRFQFINDFLGDFLNYRNVDRGREIRKQ